MADKAKNLAVLIDADNAQASIVIELLREISSLGTATVRRAYGDWTTTNLRSWKDVLHLAAIQPIQQFSYTTGKNSTDSSLIIDAMDLLHARNVDGFCIVSSDSDFTRLAARIREAGLSVYGFGEKKTPNPFVAACDKFIYTELLRPQEEKLVPDEGSNKKLESLISTAINATVRDDGWASLSAVGNMLVKNDPSFDHRTYGFVKLGDLVRKQTYLETKEVPSADGSSVVLHVRLRQAKSNK